MSNISNLSDVETIEFHEVANIFPMMSAEEFESLKSDIQSNGLLEPIWQYQGKIIDGRNRYRACLDVGVKPRFREWDGNGSLIAFVISLNLHRRHLSESQRGMIAARMANMTKSDAGRMGVAAQGKATANLQLPEITRAEAAEMLNVSERTVNAAKKVLEEATPELIALCDTGKASVTTLAPIVTAPVERQERVVKLIETGEAKTTVDAIRKAKQLEREEAVAKQVAVSPVGKPSLEVADAIEWLSRQEPADLLLTDPPYSTDVEDIVDFAASWLPLALSKVKPTGRAFICIGAYPEELHTYLSVAMPDQVLVWTYRNTLGPTPSHRYKLNWQAILYYVGKDAPPLDSPVMVEQFSVQDISAPDGRQGDRYHEWQKPLELANRFIRHCTRPGDTVIDPFACTGTFLISASKLGRVGLGCDVSIENLKIAEARGCYVKF